jgi:hypothetical protein
LIDDLAARALVVTHLDIDATLLADRRDVIEQFAHAG